MSSLSQHEKLCQFDEATKRCVRCGFSATELPYFRVCKNLEETAREVIEYHATHRISVPRFRLGDAAESVLKQIGITKARVKAATGKDCGCASRQAAMNRVGEAISGHIENMINAAVNAVLPHPVEGDEVAAVMNAIAKNPAINRGLAEHPNATIQ